MSIYFVVVNLMCFWFGFGCAEDLERNEIIEANHLKSVIEEGRLINHNHTNKEITASTANNPNILLLSRKDVKSKEGEPCLCPSSTTTSTESSRSKGDILEIVIQPQQNQSFF